MPSSVQWYMKRMHASVHTFVRPVWAVANHEQVILA